MGVSGFFRWLYNNYGQCVTTSVPKDVNWILFDLNGAIHKSRASTDWMTALKLFMRDTTSQVSPVTGLYVAVDGVAPLGKCNQQRQRRFSRHDGEALPYDPNEITAGTEFMGCVRNTVREILSEMSKELTIKFSSDEEEGEGEHKCFQFIRREGLTGKIVVVANDADLIFLALNTVTDLILSTQGTQNVPEIWIMRDNMFRNVEGVDQFFVNVNLLVARLGISMTRPVGSNQGQKKLSLSTCVQVVQDFVVLSYLFGNDFVPRQLCLRLDTATYNLLISEYIEPLTKNGRLIFTNFREYVKRLSTHESRLLESRHSWKVLDDDPGLYGEISAVTEYRRQKYQLDESSVSRYLSMIDWLTAYYHENVLSWRHDYPYHVAPLLTEIASSSDMSSSITYHPAFELPQLHLAILPQHSSHLVLPALREHLGSAVEILRDLSNAIYENEAVLLLPFIDPDNLENVYSKIKGLKLTKV